MGLGEQQRLRESRTFMHAATATLFVGAVESILGRKVRAFASAVDLRSWLSGVSDAGTGRVQS